MNRNFFISLKKYYKTIFFYEFNGIQTLLLLYSFYLHLINSYSFIKLTIALDFFLIRLAQIFEKLSTQNVRLEFKPNLEFDLIFLIDKYLNQEQ